MVEEMLSRFWILKKVTILFLYFGFLDFALSSSYNLFDLKANPNEDVNLYDGDTLNSNISFLEERISFFWDTTIETTQIPDRSNVQKSWQSCGGICPWIDYTNESSISTSTKFKYDDAPNIVFILVDDWGWNDVGYQSTYISWTTPTIDRLASEGVKLSNYFTHATCVPSRGALMTGRYPVRLGLWDETDADAMLPPELPLSEATLAQELKSAGYRTYMVGKWHLGMSTSAHWPTSRGFDYFYGHMTDSIDYWTKETSDGYLDLQNGNALETSNSQLSSEKHNVYIFEEKVEFLVEHHAQYHADTPMFLYYSLQLMQGSGSYSVPDTYTSRCEYPSAEYIPDDAEQLVEYQYCGMSVMLDEAIANLTCTLEANGMKNNTLIVITSDNGGDAAIRGNNYPFLGSKGDHYRGGLSVAALLHGTVIPESSRGSTYEGQAHVTDWMPTLMGLATGGAWGGGLTGASMDGVDMWSAIMDNTESPHVEILHSIIGYNASIQFDMLKLDVNNDDNVHVHKPYLEFESVEGVSSRQKCVTPSLVGGIAVSADEDDSVDALEDDGGTATVDGTGDDEDVADQNYYLFDLRLDPYEQANYYANRSETEEVKMLKELVDTWSYDSILLDPQVPDMTGATAAWDSCGGVCAWVDTDYTELEVSHVYHNDDAPNIVFILVDDWGWNDVGYQSTYISWTTPTIDRLASEGVKLSNYFTHATCVPSRGALMTGRYPVRLGLWDESEDTAELPLSEATLAQELKSAGYRTYMVGKWHLGMSTSAHWPTSRGFDYFYGHMTDSIDYWTKETSDGYLDLQNEDTVATSSSQVSSDVHNVFVFEDRAQFFIEHHAEYHADTPMFLYYSLQLMQGSGSYSVPDTYTSRCEYPSAEYIPDDAEQLVEYQYCGMSVMLDEAIANLTCTLEANGMKNNTLIVITSDNGGDAAIRGNNYPFLGSKGDHYRGGLSVAALLHGTVIPESSRGSTYEGQAHVTDWLPTLMGLATAGAWGGGLTGASMDGVDMWSAIMDNTESPHVEIIHAIDSSQASVQYNMTKLDVNSAVTHSHKPSYDFSSDLDEDASRELCYMPSLVSSFTAPPDPMSLLDLYDLWIDPLETSSVVNNETYQAVFETLYDACADLQDDVLDPEIPDDYEKASVWKACGGVCPWLEDSYESLAISPQYFYDDAPHIIFALVDDWGWNDVGWRSTYLDWTTPTIDRLAAEGVKLDNYFTHYSCVPSRGALMTGRFAIRLGLWDAGEMAELPLEEVTIAQEMKSAGYRTYMVGKWHLGYSTYSHLPSNRGFDSFYGYYNGYVDYWEKTHGNHLDLQSNTELVTDETEISSDVHNGYLLQRKAEQALRDHAENYSDSPMFLYYAMQLIHGVWAAPKEFLQRCDYPDSEYLDAYTQDVEYNYCALNVMLDEALANLTCALESYGMADNTVLVVVSDNGGEATVSGNNYPFRGSKGSYYRGGLSGTGFIHSKLVSDMMKGGSYAGQMHVTDWLPTLMGLATGGTWSGSLSGALIDGVDMWSAIMDNAESPHLAITHYADGEGSCSYQYNMTKIDIGQIAPPFTNVVYNFEKDLAPENTVTECTTPSLIYDEEDAPKASLASSSGQRESSKSSSETSSVESFNVATISETELSVNGGGTIAVSAADSTSTKANSFSRMQATVSTTSLSQPIGWVFSAIVAVFIVIWLCVSKAAIKRDSVLQRRLQRDADEREYLLPAPSKA